MLLSETSSPVESTNPDQSNPESQVESLTPDVYDPKMASQVKSTNPDAFTGHSRESATR